MIKFTSLKETIHLKEEADECSCLTVRRQTIGTVETIFGLASILNWVALFRENTFC